MKAPVQSVLLLYPLPPVFVGEVPTVLFSAFFFFPSFYPLPSNLMGLTRTSEYWAPNLPGQLAVTLEL